MRPLQARFNYDATEPKNRRKAPTSALLSGDAELPSDKRRKLVSGARDIARNFAIAGWMIRRHLDYVSTFSFQSKCGNDALDTQIESLIAEYSKPENFDVAGRHSLSRFARLAECRRVIDGDCGAMKIEDGRVQAIEGDRIANPTGNTKLTLGVDLDAAGKALNYAICKRVNNDVVFERMVPASNLYLHASFDRFDQVRGITPLSAALNSLRDAYEGFDYALAKMKVSQLFGLTFYREGSEPLGEVAAQDDGDDSTEDTGYQIDFGKGPFQVDLDPGDRAEFLESKSPSTEFQSFSQTIISVALKSLDIPYSFYAEDFTNYSGARQAFLQYETSADIKRSEVKALLDWITAWRLSLYVLDGLLPANTPFTWEWVPRGLPWIDPLKEIQAEREAVDGGFDNPEDICQRHGKNFYQNIDKIARCYQYAASKGVTLNTRGVTPVLVEKSNDGSQDSGPAK